MRSMLQPGMVPVAVTLAHGLADLEATARVLLGASAARLDRAAAMTPELSERALRSIAERLG